MKIARSLALLSSLVVSLSITFAAPATQAAQRPPTQVTENLWRSGRPTETILQDLWVRGVRVIIDLEDNRYAIPKEAVIAQKIGFKFYSYPTDSRRRPDDAKMKEILQLIHTSPEPVLVHCFHGEDRTGLVIGLTRVLFEGWTPRRAYDEMLSMNFHPEFEGLDQYFRDQVGSF